ncbi:uncharacterized protein LOC114516673 [Dendronephthya gigantea]|uniref:uncharacterized protein LOC114516673 n=1 Tax=Dendronephthya gigantea TaxID=151771 RepID=UPI00106A8C07|nr:uncharacterized protein LOC114516673 [Dendronephthya gigantea]
MVYKMAKSGISSAKKPRKKRQSINFLTPRERSKPKEKTTPENGDQDSQYGDSDMDLSSGNKRIKIVSSTPKSSPTGHRDDSSSESVLKTPVAREKKKTSGRPAHTTVITTENDNHDITKEIARKPATDKGGQEKEMKTSTKTKKRKRPSVNFVAYKERRRVSHHQSNTGHTLKRGENVDSDAKAFNSSVSSISRLSNNHISKLSDSCSDSQSIEHSTGVLVSSKTSQKRKMAGEKELQATPGREAKKRKTSKTASPANSSLTPTSSSTRGRPKSRKSSGIHTALDRIRDLKVTKKSFEKWKPLSKVTIAFVEDIMKSVTLSVIAEANLETDEGAGKCLATLKRRVMERIPTLKAPHTKGDYRKMESENRLSEDAYLEKSRELNILNKKIEEEQKLLDKQTAMVGDLTKQLEKFEHELEILERDKAHPLIRQSKDVLNLPMLPDDFFIEDEIFEQSLDEFKSPEERHLCETLLDLRQNNKDADVGKWMEKLTDFAKELQE